MECGLLCKFSLQEGNRVCKMQAVCTAFLELVTSESNLVSRPPPPLPLLAWEQGYCERCKETLLWRQKSAIWLPLDHVVALWRYLALPVQNLCLSHTRIMTIGCERPAIMPSSPVQRQSRTLWGHTWEVSSGAGCQGCVTHMDLRPLLLRMHLHPLSPWTSRGKSSSLVSKPSLL